MGCKYIFYSSLQSLSASLSINYVGCKYPLYIPASLWNRGWALTMWDVNLPQKFEEYEESHKLSINYVGCKSVYRHPIFGESVFVEH